MLESVPREPGEGIEAFIRMQLANECDCNQLESVPGEPGEGVEAPRLEGRRVGARVGHHALRLGEQIAHL